MSQSYEVQVADAPVVSELRVFPTFIFPGYATSRPLLLKSPEYSGRMIKESSLSPTSEEVVSMAEQEKEGKPTSVYEFAQNLFDYGCGNEPPPRIRLVKASGEVVIYEGRELTKDELENVEAVEFLNRGIGLAPEDVVMFNHGGSESTLGLHGRGMSVAVTYLLSQGMEVEFESQIGNRFWQGNAFFEKTGTRDLDQMKLDYNWAANESPTKGLTIVRVKRPSSAFLSGVSRLSRYFLPANRDYDRAAVVEKNVHPLYPSERTTIWQRDDEGVTAECLLEADDLPPSYEDYQHYIWVDGLRVRTEVDPALRWSFWGGSRLDNHRMIKRSIDSEKAEGRVTSAITEAIRNSQSPRLMSAILDLNEKTAGRDTYRYPAELHSAYTYGEDSAISSQALEAMRIAVMAKYGELPIYTLSHDVCERAQAAGKKVLLVSSGIADFFKALNAPKAEDVLNISEKKTEGNLELRVPTLFECTKMADRLIDKDAAVTYFEEPGWHTSGVFTVDLPNLSFKPDDFSKLPKLNSLPMSVLSIISLALKNRLSVKTVTYNGGIYIEHVFKFSSNIRGGDEIGISVQSFQLPNDSGKRSGTSIIFSETEQKILSQKDEDHVPLGKRLAELILKIRDRKEKLASLRAQQPEDLASELSRMQARIALYERQAAEDNRRQVEGRKQLARRIQQQSGLLEKKLFPANEGRGRVKGRDNTCENFSVLATAVPTTGKEVFSVDVSSLDRSPVGFYADFVGTKMQRVKTVAGEEVVWLNPGENFSRLWGEMGEPEEWDISSRIKLDEENWTKVPVRIDARRLTYIRRDGLIVEVDDSSGTIRAKGKGELILYQTAERESPYGHNPPGEEEFDPCMNWDKLDPAIRRRYETIRDSRYSDETKATLAMNLWTSRFKYREDQTIHEEILAKTDSLEGFNTELINRAEGICNYAATGAVLSLRMVGIAARLRGGYVLGGFTGRDSDSHGWAEYWNGRKWVPLEATVGVVNPRVSETLRKSNAFDIDAIPEEARPSTTFDRLGDLVQDESLMMDLLRELLTTEFRNATEVRDLPDEEAVLQMLDSEDTLGWTLKLAREAMSGTARWLQRGAEAIERRGRQRTMDKFLGG